MFVNPCISPVNEGLDFTLSRHSLWDIPGLNNGNFIGFSYNCLGKKQQLCSNESSLAWNAIQCLISPHHNEILTSVYPEHISGGMKKWQNLFSLKPSSVLYGKGFVSQEGYYVLVIMENIKQCSWGRDSTAGSAVCNLSWDTGGDERKWQWLLWWPSLNL